MTLRQRRIWAGVAFSAGLVLSAWLVLGALVLEVPGWVLAAVFWGAVFVFAFINAIGFLKVDQRQGEERRKERRAKQEREGLAGLNRRQRQAVRLARALAEVQGKQQGPRYQR